MVGEGGEGGAPENLNRMSASYLLTKKRLVRRSPAGWQPTRPRSSLCIRGEAGNPPRVRLPVGAPQPPRAPGRRQRGRQAARHHNRTDGQGRGASNRRHGSGRYVPRLGRRAPHPRLSMKIEQPKAAPMVRTSGELWYGYGWCLAAWIKMA